MKIVKNKFIPLPGFSAINLFGVVFTRCNTELSDVTINHESIHTKQMKELIYIVFYLVYLIEWLIRSVQEKSFKKGYRKVSFEQEAYSNGSDLEYLKVRKPYAWLKWW